MTEENQEAEPIHNYFGLSYASYLVLPRIVLQSMPQEWQGAFVTLLDKIPEEIGTFWHPEGGYRVTALDERGKFTKDPYGNYGRGRTRLKRRTEQSV